MGSKFRGPSSQKFQLVHRSQRDPLIHDAEAGTHVWSSLSSKPQPRGSNTAGGSVSRGSGKTRADLESELGEASGSFRPNVGEAAKYGVYFDDTEYDYMQHLRTIGGDYNAKRGGKDEEDEVDVVLLPAPKTQQQQAAGSRAATRDQSKGKGRGKEIGAGIALREDVEREEMQQKEADRLKLSKDMLPPDHLPERDWSAGVDVAQGLKGLQPDMDPHLRQVLEALDDDAFLLRTASASRKPGISATDAGVPRQDSEHSSQGNLTPHAAQQEASAGEKDEEDEAEEEDLDDFFADIIQGGELKSTDETPEWRALPPEGDEAIHEDPAARAARELLNLKATGQGADALSLESRVALFKAAQKSAAQDHVKLRPRRGGLDTIDSDEERSVSSSANFDRSRKPLKAPAAARTGSTAAPSSVGSQSIFGEKGAGRKSRHAGAKARLAASYYAPSALGGATAFSMSSSAMQRNEGLTDLDMQFDKLEALYEQESDDEDEEEEDVEKADQSAESGSPSHLSREDFDQVIDEFLSTQEVYGGKLKERLGAVDLRNVEKLDLFRKELGPPLIRSRDDVRDEESESSEEEDEELLMPRSAADERDKWDVETVLSTRTNLENHPRLINAATSLAGSSLSHRPQTIASSGIGSRPPRLSGSETTSNASMVDRIPKIKIDPRTGMPSISRYVSVGAREARRNKKQGLPSEGASSDVSSPSGTSSSPKGQEASAEKELDEEDLIEEEDYDSDQTERGDRVTIARDRNESAEDKRARKAAAKELKQTRKAQKADRKAAFLSERKAQSKSANGRINKGGAADVGRNGVGSAGSIVRLA